MIDVRFLIHRGCFADPEGLESLTVSPTGVLCFRATRGDCKSILELSSRPEPTLQ